MYQNRITDFREKSGLTVAALAEKLGVSEPALERMEAGIQLVRISQAETLAALFEKPLETVFPQTRLVLARMRRQKKAMEDAETDEELAKQMMAAGIDPIRSQLFLRLAMRNGVERFYPVDSNERDRFWQAVQDVTEEDPFFIFDTEGLRVALNLHHLTHCHMLFDGPGAQYPVNEDFPDTLDIYCAQSPTPYRFHITEDSPQPVAKEDDDGQFRSLLLELEMLTEPYQFITFEDANGESAIFRATDISLLEVPIWALYPELLSIGEDADEKG